MKVTRKIIYSRVYKLNYTQKPNYTSSIIQVILFKLYYTSYIIQVILEELYNKRDIINI